MTVATTEMPDAGPGAKKGRRGIRLELVDVLGHYARHRLILLRVEQLPLNSYLSHGSYAGPRTWSLKPDELDGLIYYPPEGYERPHNLKIRILSLDNNTATTLSVVEIPIDPAADLEDTIDEPSGANSKPKESPVASADLSAAKEAWEAVTEMRIQEALYIAEREAAGEEMRRLNDELVAVKQALVEREAALVETRAEADHKLEERLEAAERDGRKRLRDVEEKWRSDMERAVADAMARAEAAEAELAEYRTSTAETTEKEIKRLTDELAAAQQAMTDANAEFERRIADLTAAAEKETEARLKAAEDELRTEAARAVEEATARAARAEAELAELHTKADDELDEALLRLGDELAAAKKALDDANNRAADAEKALTASGSEIDAQIAELRRQLADAEADHAEALDEARRARANAETAMADRIAEAVHKAEEKAEARLKAAEETWRAEAEQKLLEATTRAEAAEKSVAELYDTAGQAAERAEAAEKSLAELRDAAGEATEEAMRQLGEELEAAKRAAEEATARAEALEQAGDTARTEAETTLNDKIADAIYKAEAEAEERLKAAEESWRMIAEHNLADVVNRAEAAEAALQELRASGGAQSDDELRRMSEELATAQKSLADSEAALAEAHASLERATEAETGASAHRLDELTARAEAAEAALAEAQARSESEDSVQREHIEQELETIRQALADSEAALAEARAAGAPEEAERQRLEEELAATKLALAESEAALAEAHAAPGGKPAAAPAGDPHGLLKKAQAEMLAKAERKTEEAIARAERAEAELVKARMRADRRNDDVIHNLENEVKTLQLAVAAGESALSEAQAEFDRKLAEQRSLYQQTAQQKAERMVQEARKKWETELRAQPRPTEAAKPGTNGAGREPPPAAEDRQQGDDEKRGWFRSKGGSGLFGLGGAKGS